MIVDVGTGSGCIALSLAAERPDAEVHATDISAPALEVARENAAQARASRGAWRFHLGELLEPVAGLDGRVDLVVSNPPYVDPAERDDTRARGARPRAGAGALPAGRRALASTAGWCRPRTRALRPGGCLAVEIAPTLAERGRAPLRRRGIRGRARRERPRRPGRGWCAGAGRSPSRRVG